MKTNYGNLLIPARIKHAALWSACIFVSIASSHAAQLSNSWDGGSTADGNWATVVNWNGDTAAPGSTSGTTNIGVATFNAAIANTWGLTATPVVTTAGLNIGGISFDTAAGNYFIGATGGNAIKLSSGGSIQILSTLTATNAIETVNAPLAIQGAGGTYTFANNSANGAGAGAGTLNIGGTISGAVAGATVLTLGGSNTNLNTVSGIISNGTATTLAVTKSGAGTWVLSGTNTFTGALTVEQGILQVATVNSASSSGVLGSSALAVILGKTGGITGTLEYTGATASSTKKFTMANGGTGAFQVDTSGTVLTLSGVIDGTGGLTKTGAGTLELSGITNTFSGALAVEEGVLKIGAITNCITAASSVILGRSGDGNGTFQYTGAGLAVTTRTFTLATGGTGTFQIDDNLNIGAVIDGGGSLIKTGVGRLSLSLGNTYSGTTLISNGELRLANSSALQNSVLDTTGMGSAAGTGKLTFITGITSYTLGGLTGNNNIALTNEGSTAVALSVGNNNGDTIYGGVLSGAGSSLTKIGTGDLTLSGANTYTGLTTVSAGTLRLGAAGNGTNTPLGTTGGLTSVSSGATLDLNGVTLSTTEALSLAGTGISGGGALSNSSATAATYSGQLTLENNASIVSNNGDIILSNTSGVLNYQASKYMLTLGGTATGSSLASVIGVNTGGLTKTGTGTWALSGINIYNTGVTTVSGGVLLLNNANALPGGIGSTGGINNLTFNGGVIGLGVGDFSRGLGTGVTAATFTGAGGWAAYTGDRVVNLGGAAASITWATANTGFNGQTLILGASTATNMVDLVNPLALGAVARTVQVDNGSAAIDGKLSGVLSGALGGVSKTGDGTLVLSGTNTYTGVTTFGAGTLSVATIGNGSVTSANLGSAPSAAANLVFDGGTLQYTGSNATSDRAFTINTGTTATFDTANNISFAGATGTTTSGSLTKIGAGKLTLDGTNTYSGITTISAGTLALGSAGTFANSTTIDVGSTSSTGTVLDLTAKSAFTFGSGQTLKGIGTVNIGSGKTVTNNGTLATGNSIGTLSITGGYNFGATSSWAVETDATTSDKIAISEAATITSGAAITFSGVTGAGNYVLATAASGLNVGTFAGTAPTGYTLRYSATELDLQHNATIALALGSNAANVHVGSQTVNLTIGNSAPSGSADLSYTLGGIAGSGTRTAGASSAATGTYTAVAGTNSFSITASDANATNSPQSVAFSQTGYNLAAAASTQTADVGAFHVGVAKTIGLTLNNTAAANATYTETLQSNGFSSTTSNFSAAGSTSGIIGGGSGSGSLLVGVGTGLGAGVQSGSTLLAMQSNAVNSSGLGTSSIGSQTVTINATGYNLAAAASTQTVNVGNMHVGGTKTAAVTLGNTAATDGTYTETLSSGAFSSTSSNFTATGSVSGIAGGGSSSGTLLVGLGSGLAAGAASGTTTLALNSNAVNGSGLGVTGLTAQTITITGLVYSGQGTWSGGNGSWGSLSSGFGTNWGTNQGSPGLDAGFTGVDTASFTGAGGTAALDGTSPSLKALALSGSNAYTIAKGTGSASLQFKSDAGDASLTAGSGGHLISAPVTLASNLTATVTNSGDALTLSGDIGGSFVLTKAGAGTLALSGTNSYSGTHFDAGTLTIGAAAALGSGTLTFNGGVLGVSSSFTLGNAIIVNNASYGVSVASNQTLTLSGAISGSYGLHKDGAGFLVMAGSSNSAPTIINTGTVTATAANAGSSVSLASGTTLAFDQSTAGAASYDGAISGTGKVGVTGVLTLTGSSSEFSGNIQIGGSATLTVTSPDSLGSTSAVALDGSVSGTSQLHFDSSSPNTYANNITVSANQGVLHNDGSGTVTLGGTLSKNGSVLVLQGGAFNVTGSITGASASSDLVVDASTVTLSGANDFNGPTSVINGGTLLVNGSLAAGSDVTVAAGATLGGSGSIAGAVSVSGSLSPGGAIGSLTALESLSSGALTFNDGSTFVYQMDSAAAPSVAADFQKVFGNLALSGTVTLDLRALSGVAFAANTTLALINYNGEWNGGFFTCGSTVLTDGVQFTDGANNTWQIHYEDSAGGANFAGDYVSGHFINLTNSLTAIPEPASWLALGCLLGAGTFLRSRPKLRKS